MIFTIALTVIGLISFWLLLRLSVRKWLEVDTARLKAEIKKLGLKPNTTQSTLTPFIYDHYPYERHWNHDTELELYGESSAELDLQDEDLDN